MRIARRADEQHQGAPRRPRSEEGPKDPACSNRSTHQVSLEVFGNQVGNRHRPPTQQPIEILLAQLAERTSGLQHAPQIRSVGTVDVRRRQLQRVGDYATHLAQRFLEFGILRRILARELGDVSRGLLRVVVEHNRATIRIQRDHAGFGMDQLQAVLLELHVADHVRRNRSRSVRERRAAEARVKFFGNGCAAGLRAAFEHQRLESGLREIEGGDHPVLTATDNDDVALLGHHAAPFASLRISSAESRPGAPMMPPPGCVADPHMYRFLMGVRNCAQPATGRKKNNCSSESSPCKMLPSVRPNSRSRSSGVTTCRCKMMSRMLGAYSAMVSITVSPNFSFSVSQCRPGASLYGAYCTKHDITCFPGGATEGSGSDGMTMSM